jgi:hypothetical protein
MLGLRGLTSNPPKKKEKERDSQVQMTFSFFFFLKKKFELMKHHLFKFFNKNRRRINYIGK